MGFSQEEIIGRSFFDFVHPDDIDATRRVLEKNLWEGDDVVNFENRYLCKDGTYRWLSWISRPSVEKSVTYSVARDITERKKAEEALEKRLVALTRPLGSTDALGIEDLFDNAELQRIQDQFAEAFHVASIITHPDGTPITKPSNFTRLCSEVIRSTEKGRANCYRSDAFIGRHHPEGPVVAPCLGCSLWDAGTSISVGDRHVANWLVGQVRDKTQTEQAMRAYAREIGANEQVFIEAFREVPAMRREDFEKIAGLLFVFANKLSDMACQNVQQARFIAERKQAVEALQQSEDRFRILSDVTMEGIVVHKHGIAMDLNSSLEKILGYQRDELIGKNILELAVYQEDKKTVRENIVKEHAKPYVVRAVRKNGDVFFAEIEARNIRIKGEALRVAAVRDITEKYRLEQKYRTLFNEMIYGFSLHEIIIDNKGVVVDYRFLDVNPAFEKLTNLKRASLIGKTVLEVMPNTESYWIETFGRVALTGESAFLENYSREIGRYYQATAFRPAPNQFACIFEDITGRKQAEAEREKLQKQLLQAQKMESVGRLAGGVAHDFNNMLTVIMGYTQAAMNDVDPSGRVRENLREVLDAARRSTDLTKQLLTFARKQIIDPKVLYLNRVVKRTATMLERLIGEDVELFLELSEKLWPVKMDPTQIDQILANLCVNARDAIDGVGRITLETDMKTFDQAYCAEHEGFVPGDFVLLSVSDNGCGMDREILNNLFDPFFTTKDMEKGTGLGLATIYGIVKQNNGFINVHSEPGRGSAFRIYLPRCISPDETPEPDPSAEPPPKGNETILVVEDEEAILRMTRMMLEMLGYTVLPAATPNEALALVERHQGSIHIVLTDVVMPEMNGRDLADQLKNLHPNLESLFMSGYTSDVIAHQGVLDKGVQFVQKPFSIMELAVKVREALDKANKTARRPFSER